MSSAPPHFGNRLVIMSKLSTLFAVNAIVVVAALAPASAALAQNATGAAKSGAASQPAPALTTPLPVDPKVKIGTLPNGIHYYIRKNEKPEKRAELRLVVNAG